MSKIVGFLLVFFLIISCKRTGINCECVPPKVLNGNWYFVGYVNTDKITINEIKPQHPFDTYLLFDEKTKTMEGKMAVNLISANYNYLDRTNDYRGNDLTFNQLGSTKIAVTDTQGAFELLFFEKLLKISSYEITNDGNLLLFDKKPNSSETMVFKKYNFSI